MTSYTMTRRLRAPEDIRVGEYVVKSFTRYQLVPRDLERPVAGEAVDPIVLIGWPYDAGEPMKVRAVCLPFVMVESPYGGREAIDTRQHVLARVSKAYGKAAKPEPEKTKKKRKRKGKRKKKKKKD